MGMAHAIFPIPPKGCHAPAYTYVMMSGLCCHCACSSTLGALALSLRLRFPGSLWFDSRTAAFGSQEKNSEQALCRVSPGTPPHMLNKCPRDPRGKSSMRGYAAPSSLKTVNGLMLGRGCTISIMHLYFRGRSDPGSQR